MDQNLITIPQGELVSTEIVHAIAKRLQLTYTPPKRRNNQTEEEYQANVVQEKDFPVVVELAMAQGHNPLSKTFHYWKQDGAVKVDDHYAPLMNWAQSKCPFTYTTEVLDATEKANLEGINPGDYVVRFRAIRRADQKARQEYFKTILDSAVASGKDFDEALEIAEDKADAKFAVQANGVVQFNEIHYQKNNQWVLNVYATPKGWVPGVSRAEVRAIRNGIKKLVGMPMPEERRRLGIDLDMRHVAQLAAQVPVEIVEQGVSEEYMKLAAHNREVLDEFNQLPPEERRQKRQENVEILRGKEEGAIGEEPFDVAQDETVLVPETDIVEEETVLPEEHSDLDAEYESRQISLEEAKPVLVRSYKSEEGLNKAISNLLGFNYLQDLPEVWRWNFYQYALRRNILNDVNIPLEDRLNSIPELKETTQPIKTLKAAGEFMHETLKILCSTDKRMRRLTVE